jgi:hypothetical protein
MKQTAVDYLLSELQNVIELYKTEWEELDSIVKQAKEMERMQIKDAYSAGVWEIGYFNRTPDSNKYYEENYGKK